MATNDNHLFGGKQPANTPKPATPKPASGAPAAETARLEERYRSLVNRKTAQEKLRWKLEAELRAAQDELAACQAEAAEMGIASLEELEAKIHSDIEATTRAYDEAEKALDEEAELLESVRTQIDSLR